MIITVEVVKKINRLTFIHKLFSFFAYLLLKLWHKTLSLELTNEVKEAFKKTEHGVCVFYLWHNTLFAAPKLRAYRSKRNMYGLISASKDGAWLSDILKYFKIDAIRGSSSWRGKTALKEIYTKITNDSECDIVITPDGPKGPKYKCKSGSLKFVQELNLPVIFLYIKCNAWELNSWDSFKIPKPFSRVTVSAKYFKTLQGFDGNIEDFANEAFNSIK